MKIDSIRPSAEFIGLQELVRSYGDERLRQDLDFVIEQSAKKAVSVAVLGQFKRGKSTLVNALLQEDVLPTGRLPLTGVMTRIFLGDERAIAVYYSDGRIDKGNIADLARYVTEEHNPMNRLGVAHVDVSLPVDFLDGLILIDTPGIGSTLGHNTSAAHDIAERVDIALFVTGPEPPITRDERSFLEQIQELADKVIVVIAKIDMASGFERDVIDFTRREIGETRKDEIELYPVNGTRNDDRITALRQAIIRIASGDHGAVFRRSRDRRLRRIASRILLRIEFQRAAALLPIQERERARSAFAELANDIQERGDDLIRAIELFPKEELLAVDLLLDSLVADAIPMLDAELEDTVRLGIGAGERALYLRVSELEAQWSDRLASSLADRIQKRQSTTARVLADIEARFMEAAKSVLGLRQSPEAAQYLEHFGRREAVTRMSGPVPTTGLEIVNTGAIALLPGALRSHVLRRRFRSLGIELLDRIRGRLRSASVRYLQDWRLANAREVREQLAASRRVVEDAFDAASGSPAVSTTAVEALDRDQSNLSVIVASLVD